MRSRFIIIPLLNKFRISTNGNIYGAGTTVFLDIDVPQFAQLLPQALELTLFSLGEDMTTNLRWGLYFYSGYTRTFEGTTPIQIGSTVGGTAFESKRHNPYTTVNSFNLDSRLLLGVGNSAGGGFETGVASASLGVLTVGA